jgi:hypothetical protein
MKASGQTFFGAQHPFFRHAVDGVRALSSPPATPHRAAAGRGCGGNAGGGRGGAGRGGLDGGRRLLVNEFATRAAGCGDQNSFHGWTPSSPPAAARQGGGGGAGKRALPATASSPPSTATAMRGQWGRARERRQRRIHRRDGAAERRRGEFFGVALQKSPKYDTGNMNSSKLHRVATWQPFWKTRRTELPQNGAFSFYSTPKIPY